MSEHHWDAVYSSKGVDEVSWYQQDPEPSLRLLDGCRSVIDVGSGRSALAGRLAAQGVSVTLLDISPAALEAARTDLGPLGAAVDFVVADVVTWRPDRTWQAWHDRAVFHFLTDPSDQQRYVETARASLEPGGRLVLGCFASDGPEQCSGLPTARHDAADLVERFTGFTLQESFRLEHSTPWGAAQMFTWAVFIQTD